MWKSDVQRQIWLHGCRSSEGNTITELIRRTRHVLKRGASNCTFFFFFFIIVRAFTLFTFSYRIRIVYRTRISCYVYNENFKTRCPRRALRTTPYTYVRTQDMCIKLPSVKHDVYASPSYPSFVQYVHRFYELFETVLRLATSTLALPNAFTVAYDTNRAPVYGPTRTDDSRSRRFFG